MPFQYRYLMSFNAANLDMYLPYYHRFDGSIILKISEGHNLSDINIFLISWVGSITSPKISCGTLSRENSFFVKWSLRNSRRYYILYFYQKPELCKNYFRRWKCWRGFEQKDLSHETFLSFYFCQLSIKSYLRIVNRPDIIFWFGQRNPFFMMSAPLQSCCRALLIGLL